MRLVRISRTSLAEQAHYLIVLPEREAERRHSVLGPNVDIRTSRDEQLGHIPMASMNRGHEQRPCGLVQIRKDAVRPCLRVHTYTFVQQVAHNIEVASRDRKVERCRPVAPEIGAVRDEHPNGRHVAGFGGGLDCGGVPARSRGDQCSVVDRSILLPSQPS